jgi:hypothetical protein
MNKPQELITVIMQELSEQIEEANQGLCEVLDTFTDENCKPLPHLNPEVIYKLKDIAYSLYCLYENQIPDEVDDMVSTMLHFYKPKM